MKNIILTVLIYLGLLINTTKAQNQENYNWRQVKIGGGGYITGIKIHPNNNNVAYFRTDVGGAYRWDSNKKEMVQLLNFSSDKKNYYGVAGMALHPEKENIIYLAVDRGNTTNTSKILYSENYGADWQEIDVVNGIKFGANGGREGNIGINDKDREGAPIIINPTNPNELWVGTREKGLWVLDLTQADQWRKINDIPDNDQEASIRTVLFHPENPNFIYVGYAQFGIYRSSNGGNSFQLINNGNDDLKLVSDLSLSKTGSKLYAAVRNKGIYKLLSPETSLSWEKLTIPFTNLTSGYQTVTASPHDDDVVLAMPAAAGGKNLARLQVSKDNGITWVTKSQTNITSSFGWRSTDNAGAYISQIAFDPVDAKKITVSCWFGLWHTDNWDEVTVNWKNDRAKGHEEIVTSGLVAFPENSSNNKLVINSADSPAIVTKNTDSYENSDITTFIDDDSYIVKGQDAAVCEAYPNNFIISATKYWKPTNGEPSYGSVFYTNNGGRNYYRMLGYEKEWGKALIATSVYDPANVVVVHGNQIHYSKDRGTTFIEAEMPDISNVVENDVFIAHDPLAQDLVTNQVFYLYDKENGSIFRSLNSGKRWLKTKNNLPIDNNKYTKSSLKAAPGKAGHLWFNHPKEGLFWSANGGDDWTKLPNVLKATLVALGKPMNSNAYPTLYMIGVLRGTTKEALYRSTNKGERWDKISDDRAQFILSSPKYIAADRSIFGKVYVGVSGLGVWQGEIEDGTLSNTKGSFLNEETNIKLYPLPADDILHIDFNQTINKKNKWELYDLQGKKNMEGNSDTVITKALKPGFYIIVIEHDNQIVRRKLIKK